MRCWRRMCPAWRCAPARLRVSNGTWTAVLGLCVPGDLAMQGVVVLICTRETVFHPGMHGQKDRECVWECFAAVCSSVCSCC